jgi:glycosyltransferase involved in cell wall biosynthesis
LSNELAKDNNVELHIVTLSPYVNKDYRFIQNHIHFHVLKRFYRIPILNLGLPRYVPLDVVTLWQFDRIKLDNELKRINPDLTHIHGTEGIYGISNYSLKKAHLVTIQGISNLYNNELPKSSSYPYLLLEKSIIRKYKYFGNRTDFGKEFILSINKNAEFIFTPESINQIFFDYNTIKDSKSLIFIGDIIERKGVDILIKALELIKKEFKEIKLNVVGTGNENYISELKKLAKDSGVDRNINWLGYKTNIEIKELFKLSSIFVFPTLIDNSPNSLLEAMASGLICIASETGGIPSIIKNKMNGYLFQKKDYKRLAELVISVINNFSQNIKVSKNAIDFSKSYCRPDYVFYKTVEVYNEIIMNKV